MPVSDYGHDKDGKPLSMTKGRPPEMILTLNTWIKKYTSDNDIVYLDYFSAMVDDKGFLKAISVKTVFTQMRRVTRSCLRWQKQQSQRL